MTQDEALEVLKSGKNVFLTGEPGSGKTHTVNQFIGWLAAREVYPAVTASTGIAATHINGMTIHSWSGIGIKKEIKPYDIKQILSKDYARARIMSCKVLIIDEVSMLSAETLDNVDKVLRYAHGNDMPFGGIQVILVGDFYQLPPVSKEGPVRFAFEAFAWKAAAPIVCYLTEQHRTDDPVYLDILSSMRAGNFTAEHRATLTSRVVQIPAIEGITKLFTHNADVDRINSDELEKIPSSEKKVFHMRSYGIPFVVETLKKSCLSPETLVLKKGAKVMFTRNNFDKGYVNGTLGEVTDFDSNGLPLVLTKDGKTHTAEWTDWSIMDDGEEIASVSQIPLRLAWAITVHKSQGMSLDAAAMDLRGSFEYGQGYVALSRVRSLAGLYLVGLNEKALMMHPRVIEEDKIFRA